MVGLMVSVGFTVGAFDVVSVMTDMVGADDDFGLVEMSTRGSEVGFGVLVMPDISNIVGGDVGGTFRT